MVIINQARVSDNSCSRVSKKNLIKIIPQQSFKSISWKNGKGITLELAINNGGTLANFDWRLSIAKVDNNGEFSDFKGYTRNLVLIDGKGVILKHNDRQIDRLDKLLDVSTFDGGDKTNATLIFGPICDLNLITKTKKITSSIETFKGKRQVTLKCSQLCFIYGLRQVKIVSKQAQIAESLVAGDLMQISNNRLADVVVTGENFIVANIIRR